MIGARQLEMVPAVDPLLLVLSAFLVLALAVVVTLRGRLASGQLHFSLKEFLFNWTTRDPDPGQSVSIDKSIVKRSWWRLGRRSRVHVKDSEVDDLKIDGGTGTTEPSTDGGARPVTDLRGSDTPSTGGDVEDPDGAGPAFQASLGEGIHVDREAELALFRGMLAEGGSVHILLIQAAQGMGKTSLIKRLVEEARERSVVPVHIDLKRASAWSRQDFLDKLTTEIGPDRFPEYDHALSELVASGVGGVSVSVDRSSVSGVVSIGPDRDMEAMRHRLLTQALRKDLSNIPQITPLLLDTFEAASPAVQEYVSLLLSSIRDLRRIVLVIAGRRVPEFEYDWSDFAASQTLDELEERHVREYVDELIRKEHLGIEVSDDHVAVLYSASDGRPTKLRIEVEKFLRKQGHVT